MNQILEQLIEEKKIAYAIYNDKLNLYKASGNLKTMLNVNEFIIDDSLFEAFPEFFGSEKEIYKVQSGKSQKLVIEKVNRLTKNNEVTYFDFVIIRAHETNNYLLLLVSDSTKESTLQQKINQQQNEIHNNIHSSSPVNHR